MKKIETDHEIKVKCLSDLVAMIIEAQHDNEIELGYTFRSEVLGYKFFTLFEFEHIYNRENIIHYIIDYDLIKNTFNIIKLSNKKFNYIRIALRRLNKNRQSLFKYIEFDYDSSNCVSYKIPMKVLNSMIDNVKSEIY